MNSPEKKVTINQVANYCGVSKTTISRFLNGKFENMSTETRDKIEAAIVELKYRPDRSAQRLKARKSMLIGCVMGDVSSPFSALLLKGITSVCEEAGYQVLFADSRENSKRERRAIQGFLDNRVDGLIINTCGGNDEYIINLLKLGVPVVLADRSLKNPGLVDTVSSPNKESARECTGFLFDQGYEHVAFFSETIGDITPRILRRDGYIEGFEKRAAAEDRPEVYELYENGSDNSIHAVESYRAAHPGKRIAILSSNGTTSQRILTAMKSLGINAGYELGLCTFDDWNWLKIAEPSITAVAQGTVEIGAKSAQLLLERIDGERLEETAADITIPSALIVRESTPAESA